MTRSFIIGLIRVLAGASVRWIGSNPEPRQRIYFANHTSNLDGPVLWSSLPEAIREKTRMVAAHDYWTATPARRYMANKVFNTILIERKKITVSNNPLRLLLEALSKGDSLIIFPEGGRSRDEDPLPFKSGIYHLGQERPDVELIPVWIDNMNRILPKGEILPVPLMSCLTFGAPLGNSEKERRDEFLSRARHELMALRHVKR